jgi:hypothetical protein
MLSCATIGKTWNDIPALIAEATPAAPFVDPRDAEPPKSYSNVTPLDTIRHMLERYLVLKRHEYIATTLWTAHTHVFDKFMVTPRLAPASPVRNCGKTTLLGLLNLLVARAEKTDNATAAAVYCAVDQRRTLLLDEGDNLELSARAAMRAVLNSGYHRGGGVTRMVGGRRRRFSTFAPIALASIGSLPLPLMSRSIVIRMERAKPPERFDSGKTEDFDAVYRHIVAWARDADINSDPEMPAEVRGRLADNWRPLIAIADACGQHGAPWREKLPSRLVATTKTKTLASCCWATFARSLMRVGPTGSRARFWSRR